MKNIYQIATNVTLAGGGQRTAVVSLNDYLNSGKVYSSTIITNEKEVSDNFVEFKSVKFKFWSYAKGLSDHILTAEDIDIFHLHGVWMHTQHASSKIAKNNNIPYVITPHGMVQPWYLADKKLKKSIYLNLFLRSIFTNANVIHAITPLERDNLYKLSGHHNIVEIPNFIHLKQLPPNLSFSPQEDYLLFLSRIHPGKGLDVLFKAMSKIENKKIKLKVVGEENSYSNILKTMARNLGIENRIEFAGAVYGNEKYSLYANAKAFVMPSYSEAIGMVNLEAAACKTPVITTFDTGLHKDWNNSGGLLITPTEDALTHAINNAVSWSVDERIQRGNMLSDFVATNYSWENKGHLWYELYNSLIKKG